MTERELREIKRRFRPGVNNIANITGCLVNENRVIISKINQSIALSDSDVGERLLGVMKRALSGTLGSNLTDIAFSTAQVSGSEEHRLISELRNTHLKDEAALEKFYAKVIDSVSFSGNFVILLANDIYDVFTKGKDGAGDSTAVFSYIVCAVCPIQNVDGGVCFREGDSLFHAISSSAVLSNPELGFMFPAFDDRAANIYNALFYTRSISESHEDFIKNIFGTKAPIPPAEQKLSFNQCIKESFGEDCDIDMIKSVQRQVSEMIESHKEAKIPEMLTVNGATLKSVFENCGIDEQKIEKFGQAIEENFGVNAEIFPKNLVETKKFELKTPDVTIKVNPDAKELVCTEVINGVKYILIRATEGVEVNGVSVDIK